MKEYSLLSTDELMSLYNTNKKMAAFENTMQQAYKV